MILTLSINTRPLSILPAWRCYRAVKASSSPAFQAMKTVLSLLVNAQTIPNLFRDLRNTFDTQRASADDRLQDGQTLLHGSNLSRSSTTHKGIIISLLSESTYVKTLACESGSQTRVNYSIIDLCSGLYSTLLDKTLRPKSTIMASK